MTKAAPALSSCLCGGRRNLALSGLAVRPLEARVPAAKPLPLGLVGAGRPQRPDPAQRAEGETDSAGSVEPQGPQALAKAAPADNRKRETPVAGLGFFPASKPDRQSKPAGTEPLVKLRPGAVKPRPRSPSREAAEAGSNPGPAHSEPLALGPEAPGTLKPRPHAAPATRRGPITAQPARARSARRHPQPRHLLEA